MVPARKDVFFSGFIELITVCAVQMLDSPGCERAFIKRLSNKSDTLQFEDEYVLVFEFAVCVCIVRCGVSCVFAGVILLCFGILAFLVFKSVNYVSLLISFTV